MSDLPLETLLPLRAVSFRMRFTDSANPGVLHQPALTAWVRRMLGSPERYDQLLCLNTPDAMRRRFSAGDPYHFTLIAMAGGEALLADFFDVLRKGENNMAWDAAMPFRDHFKLEETCDALTGESCADVNALSLYDADALERDTQFWLQRDSIHIRWISPARLMRSKESREGVRGEMRFCRDNDHLTAPLLLGRVHDTFADLLQRRGESPRARREEACLEGTSDVFWVDAAYRNANHVEKPMGGMLGALKLRGCSGMEAARMRAMVLGQYVGIGQRRAFGYGRYRMEDIGGQSSVGFHNMTPSTSLLDIAMGEANLESALETIRDNQRQYQGASDTHDEPSTMEMEKLAGMARKVLRGTYKPPPLNGYIHQDADGDIRPLAVPPFMDRVMQRAVAQSITPPLDALMDDASFGFRAGRSRFQARDLVQNLYREGYRWVFESDIRHFFDMVDWERLENRLSSLFTGDPVIRLVMDWLRVPVMHKGRRIERKRGLPQGAPLSPLLANLMLDDFDSDLRAAGCRLVRFADDFIVVAKSRKDAEKAGRIAVRSLADAGLNLKTEKTRVIDFSEGFRFLGFIFVDGVAVECKPRKHQKAGQVPAYSWLADYRCQDDEDESEAKLDTALRSDVVTALAPFAETGRTMIVCGHPAVLFSRDGRLCAERDDEVVCSEPWRHLEHVMIFGSHHVTTPALKEAMRHDVVIHFASGMGKYYGVVSPPSPRMDQASRWQLQISYFGEHSHALHAARVTVDARIRHMREVLRKKDALNLDVSESFKSLLEKAERASDLNELNGYEGLATRCYFGALKPIIPSEFDFSGRNRRPPLRGKGEKESLPLVEQIHRQNLALLAWMSGKAPVFRAWRMR